MYIWKIIGRFLLVDNKSFKENILTIVANNVRQIKLFVEYSLNIIKKIYKIISYNYQTADWLYISCLSKTTKYKHFFF